MLCSRTVLQVNGSKTELRHWHNLLHCVAIQLIAHCKRLIFFEHTVLNEATTNISAARNAANTNSKCFKYGTLHRQCVVVSTLQWNMLLQVPFWTRIYLTILYTYCVQFVSLHNLQHALSDLATDWLGFELGSGLQSTKNGVTRLVAFFGNQL